MWTNGCEATAEQRMYLAPRESAHVGLLLEEELMIRTEKVSDALKYKKHLRARTCVG